MREKREYGTNGKNGTDGRFSVFFPSVPFFPFVPYSLFDLVSRSPRLNADRSRFLVLSLICLLISTGSISAQSPVRLAVLDLAGDERREIGSLLKSLARDSKSPSFELIDDQLVKVAVRGAGYAGSLNLSRDEARALGQSLGCDFYILGRILLTRRAVSNEDFYFDALAGLFIVEARTGALTSFVFDRAKSGVELEAHDRLKDAIGRQWARSASAIVSARERLAAEIESLARPSAPLAAPPVEVFSDDPDAQGIERPVFHERLKPAYTEQADLAGIMATVELEAVFGEDGKVAGVEVVRWAGFGLDESAIATVRQLRFDPAKHDGKNVTIRGLVRYNFRRPPALFTAPQAASPEEIERIRRSLREILSPRQSTGKRPNS